MDFRLCPKLAVFKYLITACHAQGPTVDFLNPDFILVK